MTNAGDALIGHVLKGVYRIERRIAEGGMGRVYLATHLELDASVVVKVLRPVWADDAEAVRRFLREAKLTAQLRHPNNVRTMDFARTDDGLLYMVMELVEGVSLAELPLPLPIAEAVSLVTDIAAGLAEAHAADLVHRDLKPDNVVVQQFNGRSFARVVDYGIARPAEGSTRLTQAGTILGTPRYMSPEQAAGLPIDCRSDIYSLGVILYELLTGQRPFDGSDDAVLEAQRFQSPAPLSDLVEVPTELDDLVERCLSKQREYRPASAAELHAELLQLQQSLALVADPSLPAPRVRPRAEAPDETSLQPASGGRAFVAQSWLILAVVVVALGVLVVAIVSAGADREPVAGAGDMPELADALPSPSIQPCTVDDCELPRCAESRVCTGYELIPLRPEDLLAEQRIGADVTLDGDQLALGSSGRSDRIVYSRRQPDGTWSTEWVEGPVEDGTDHFGSSVSLQGDLLVVGAAWTSDVAEQAGAVHVYDRQGDEWVYRTRLTAPDPEQGLRFGFRVAAHGTRVFVSAVKAHPWPTDTIWVFDCSQRTCPPDGEIRVPEQDVVRGFGNALDVSQDRVIVGALSNRMWDEGQAYLYERAAPLTGQWERKATFRLEERSTAQYFGCSVGISGDWAVVSACPNPNHPALALAVVYQRTAGGEWVESARWTETDLNIAEPAVIYADIDYPDVAISTGDGRIVVMRHDVDSGWEDTLTINGPDSAGWFAHRLELQGRRIVAGAPMESVGRPMTGAGYVLEY